MNTTYHHRNDTIVALASGQRSKPHPLDRQPIAALHAVPGDPAQLGAGPDPDHSGAIGAQALAVIADYDQVRTWSDPSARQCELARIGATAVDLLRRLSA